MKNSKDLDTIEKRMDELESRINIVSEAMMELDHDDLLSSYNGSRLIGYIGFCLVSIGLFFLVMAIMTLISAVF